MVVTHFMLAGRGITGATVGGAPVVVVVCVVDVVTADGLSVTMATGLAKLVWISALLARAVLNFSLICSICSCSSCSSPGWGGATAAGGGATATGGGVSVTGGGVTALGEGAAVLALAEEEDVDGRESTRLANEAAGPPFSHSLLFGLFCSA